MSDVWWRAPVWCSAIIRPSRDHLGLVAMNNQGTSSKHIDSTSPALATHQPLMAPPPTPPRVNQLCWACRLRNSEGYNQMVDKIPGALHGSLWWPPSYACNSTCKRCTYWATNGKHQRGVNQCNFIWYHGTWMLSIMWSQSERAEEGKAARDVFKTNFAVYLSEN